MDIDQWFGKRSIRIVYALFLVVISIAVINPYRFGVHDHWYMLPWIKNLIDPGLFTVDPIIAQRDYHYSVLYRLMAYSPLPLESSFFIVYFLSLAMIFYISMAVHRLFSNEWIYLSPLFLIIPWLTPGGTFTIASHLLMRTTGLALLMVVLYFWLKQKPWLAWPLLGLAFLFHPISALFMAVFMGVHLVIDRSRRGDRKEWLSILGFILLSIPVFVEKFTAPDTGFPGFWADDYWLGTVRIRSSHHTFPDAWPLPHLLSGFGLLAILISGVLFCRKAKWQLFLAAILTGFVLIFSAGLIFTYWWPAFLAIQVQPFRVSRLMIVLALLFIPVMFSTGRDIKRAPQFLTLLMILLLGSALMQSVLHLLWYVLLSSILMVYWLLPKLKKAVPLVLISAFVLMLLLRHPQKPELNAVAPEEEWRLYEWIRLNTPEESLWIIPGDMMYFRNFTDRSALVTWWDGTFGYFDYQYNRDWRTRYETVYGEFDIHKTEPQVSDPAEVGSLTQEFSPNGVYILKRQPMMSGSFREVWSDGDFYVYTVVR